MKKPINKCKDKSFVKIPGVSWYLINKKGVFEPGQMTVLYASAMDKKLQGYSSSERTFILNVGGEAFNKTMKQFVDQEKKDNEEKRDNSNGND